MTHCSKGRANTKKEKKSHDYRQVGATGHMILYMYRAYQLFAGVVGDQKYHVQPAVVPL